AAREGTPVPVVMKKAERYAREIIPSFSPMAYFGIGTRVSKWISEFLYRVRLGFIDDESFKEIDPNASVVFVMNHRSNMDYVLVTYLASSRTTLSYAVGEWARIWGVQSLIRAMGAYFIRRSSRNELYRRVLARYVSMATREGVTQAVFPEGGLTRNGKLMPPKLGLLSYMLSDFQPESSRDIVFVPVGINYDRALEDRILTSRREAEVSGRDFSVSIPTSIGFVFTMLKRRLQGTLYRLGYACVSFGNPISLKEWLVENGKTLETNDSEKRNATIETLGERLINEVGNVVPALPVSLVSSVFVEHPEKTFNELELKSEISDLVEQLEKSGHHVHIPRADLDYAISTGLRMLVMRHMVLEDENGTLTANKDERVLLEYYANSIAHLLDNSSMRN
ncbi:MAG: 1-acyl-sn-glycerol-3-phosphate acyltransferase, partial [Rhizobiaceae bacterium]|nr:1-acyl-sn-glycerol-3-phosphate acyltransferase [Rhizobiaceae bacterium]